MKKLLLTLAFLFAGILHAQEFEYDVSYDTVSLGKRDFYLNSITRATYLEGNTRAFYGFAMPENTIKWFYSFTTQKGESGLANLNLAAQLASIAVDPTLGTTGSLNVPDGVAKVNVYAMQAWQSSLFQEGGTFMYSNAGSSLGSPQGVIELNDRIANNVVIGVENTSQTEGVHVFVEAVAIVENKVMKNRDAIEKAFTYGQLAVTKLDYGQYDLAKAYCDSSLALYELGWVYGTKSVCHFVMNQDGQATNNLVKGIELMKVQEDYNANIKLIQKEFRLVKKREKRKDAQQYIDMLWSHRFIE